MFELDFVVHIRRRCIGQSHQQAFAHHVIYSVGRQRGRAGNPRGEKIALLLASSFHWSPSHIPQGPLSKLRNMSTSSYLESLFGLAGRTALCTGATRGIGQTIAVALAKAGADIVLVQVRLRTSCFPRVLTSLSIAQKQRSKENLETFEMIKALGRQVDVAVCDLADKDAVKGLTRRVTSSSEEVEGGLGRSIDILINCGGIQRR